MDIAMKIAFIILIVACMGTLLCSCDDKLDIPTGIRLLTKYNAYPKAY